MTSNLQFFLGMTLILPILNIQRYLDRHTNETDQRTDRQSGKNPPPLKKSILTLICFYSIALFPRLSSDCPLLHPLLFLYKHAAGYIVYILFYFTPSPISICTDPVLGSFDRNRIYTYQIHTTLCDISTFHRDCGSYAIALFRYVYGFALISLGDE